MKHSFGFAILCIVILLYSASGVASILHVPSGYASIKEAVNAAVEGDTVLIADGTYSGSGNRNVLLTEKNLVIESESGSAHCIIDCESSGRAFKLSVGVSGVTVIRNLTIQNGFMNGSKNGGAIWCELSTPIIENCVFVDNTAGHGGGIGCSDASPGIVNCYFSSNSGNYGGAISGNASNPIIVGSRFIDNTAVLNGGGVYLANSGGEVTSCVFTDNSAFQQGGGISLVDANPVIGGSEGSGNTFMDNHAGSGADLACNQRISYPVNAQYNAFHGCQHSDYYISPPVSFDLSHCTSELTPITQNVYVSTTGDDNNDGLSWNTAFRTLRHAVSHVIGTEAVPVTISVQAGTYSQLNTGERFPIALIEHVNIEGESSETTIFDAEQTASGIVGAWDDVVEISGLTITNSTVSGIQLFASSPLITYCSITHCKSKPHGGGIFCDTGSNPVIRDCTISDNIAEIGGGIACRQSSPTIQNCQLFRNIVYPFVNYYLDPVGCASGAGIACVYSSPDISDCVINSNYSVMFGGGIACWNYSSPGIYRNTFSGNFADNNGGGIFVDSANPLIGGSPEKSNRFEFNHSGAGSDLFAGSSQTEIITATTNAFAGYAGSDYYVSPGYRFNVEDSTSDLTPIMQDVYVSESGSNANTGLSWNDAFRNVDYALSRVIGSEEQPIKVHIGPGLYSYSSCQERFPIPLLPHVELVGAGIDLSILDAESNSCVLRGVQDDNIRIAGLTIQHGINSGVYLDNTDIILTECKITENQNSGMLCMNNSHYSISQSLFSDNSGVDGGGITSSESKGDLTNCVIVGNDSYFGGGIGSLEDRGLRISNCLITQNIGNWGGGAGIGLYATKLILENSTIVDNSAPQEGGGILCYSSNPEITNCIFSQNQPQEFNIDEVSEPMVTYSDIHLTEGVYPGEGNISSDPLFVQGPGGGYYLSQLQSGQLQDSPCLNTGSMPSDKVIIRLPDGKMQISEFTTRTDQICDDGMVDMGFHYPVLAITPTPLPSATPTTVPTANPTMTALPTSTPPALTLGVDLVLSSNLFSPEDQFKLQAIINNPGPETYENQPLVILLDVYSYYYWYPAWSEDFTFEPVSVDVGSREIAVLEFTWPETDSSGTGINIYGALMTPEMNDILGEYDFVTFGWE